MEQLKYGIEKDKRAEARADAAGERAERGMQIQEAQESRSAQRHADEASKRLVERGKYDAQFKMNQILMSTKATPENVRAAVDLQGTMNDRVFKKSYDEMIKVTGAENMKDIQTNPAALMILTGATDGRHRKSTMKFIDDRLEESEAMPVEQQAGYVKQRDQLMQERQALEDAENDPVGTAQKKLERMEFYYSQIQDPQAQAKTQYLIDGQRSRVKSLRAAETAKGTTATKTPIFRTDDWSGEVEKDYVMTSKGGKPVLTQEQKDMGFGFKDPGKQEPKKLEVGNDSSLSTQRQKIQRGIAWAEKYGDLTQIEVATMDEEEAKKHSEYPAAIDMIKNLQNRLNEIDNAIALTRQGWTMKQLREVQAKLKEERGIEATYEDVINFLSVGSTAAP
jgi:hypothetical protein